MFMTRPYRLGVTNKNMRYFLLLLSLFLAIFPGCAPERKSDLAEEIELLNKRVLIWHFPLPRTHTGVLLGNGDQGLMVWGGENRLNVTIGRAGFWDRRGSVDFLTRTTYKEVKRLLLRGDHDGLAEVFEVGADKPADEPNRPHQIGGGRLELTLPEGWKLIHGVLDLNYGTLEVLLNDPSGAPDVIRVRQSVNTDLGSIVLPSYLMEEVQVSLVPSWEHVKGVLEPVGVEPPVFWTESIDGSQISGFTQYLPEDDPLAIGYRIEGNRLLFATGLGSSPVDLLKDCITNISPIDRRIQNIQWWEQYWKSVPEIVVPDPFLQDIINYGLYKQAIATPPHAVACALQGPFNEEYQLPPWSNDYHFNINIQMIYLPALASNRAEHLDPLWKMIRSWMPVLRENGESFFERQGAMMLPHAVNDRGKVVGSFWTGTIDHACTAWMAQLAWLHYRHTMDSSILKEIAWPLLNGAFEGYWAMMEEIPVGKEGKRYTLPVSVSPEFKGSRMDAWGRDASFQLAAAHMICDIMPRAAAVLGQEVDPRWKDVDDNLPEYTLVSGPSSLERPESIVERVALWEGMDLIESHRHHSHMACIYPFGTIDPDDPRHMQIVDNTYRNWIRKGPGAWSGWCVPWAAILHNRKGNVEASLSWLKYWYDNFTNEGRGTLHDAAFPGISNISSPGWFTIDDIDSNREKMQLDAGFGALSAAMDLLVHQKGDVIHVLPRVPIMWKDAEFKGIITEGAFSVGAVVKGGKKRKVTVYSEMGGQLKLAHGLGEKIKVDGEVYEGLVFEKETVAGETIVLESI